MGFHFNIRPPARTPSHEGFRALVLPMMPEAAKGLDEDVLAGWVTRDSMIGTGLPKAPV